VGLSLLYSMDDTLKSFLFPARFPQVYHIFQLPDNNIQSRRVENDRPYQSEKEIWPNRSQKKDIFDRNGLEIKSSSSLEKTSLL